MMTPSNAQFNMFSIHNVMILPNLVCLNRDFSPQATATPRIFQLPDLDPTIPKHLNFGGNFFGGKTQPPETSGYKICPEMIYLFFWVPGFNPLDISDNMHVSEKLDESFP